MTIRAAAHRIGGRLLEKLINADGGRYRGSYIPCGQGHRARFVEFRNKELLTALAPVEVQRAYYHCEPCEAGVIPKDRELDIVNTGFSPGVRRMMGQVGGACSIWMPISTSSRSDSTAASPAAEASCSTDCWNRPSLSSRFLTNLWSNAQHST